MDNANTVEYLEKIKNQVIENIKRTTFAPSVQMQDVPRDPEGMDDEADAMLDDLDEDENKDTRYTSRRWDKYTEKEGELSESEDEDGNERNGVRRTQQTRKRMNIMDYSNPDAVADDDEIIGDGSRVPSRGSHDENGEGQTSAVNGTGKNSPSAANSPSQKSGGASPAPADEPAADADVEMADDAEPESAPTTQQVAEGAQEATPPASPPAEVAPTITADAPSTPVEAAASTEAPAETEDHPMEDAVDAPVAQANGIVEREEENVAAEKATEEAAKEE